jgi:hypothetical protein
MVSGQHTASASMAKTLYIQHAAVSIFLGWGGLQLRLTVQGLRQTSFLLL